MEAPSELISLAHALADGPNPHVILSEGNVSCASEVDSFWVKASGRQMLGIDAAGFVVVRSAPLLQLISGSELSEAETRSQLDSAMQFGAPQARPSTEAFVHAAILQLPGVRFVAHSHPPAIISLLITDFGKKVATKRFYPDEIVLCGRASCFVQYTAPGLPLARTLQTRTEEFRSVFGETPKVWLLQNHGLITTGRSWQEAISATHMAVKSAEIVLKAIATGSEPNALGVDEVNQIANWSDEHARQKMLWGES